jgi:chromosome segregation ATPase
LPHPLGFSQEEEQQAAQAGHSPPAPRPCSKGPRLEKASEELVSHVRTFAKDVEHRINNLISGWSFKQKELSVLQDSHREVILERDELRGKLNDEIRENEGYKKEIEDLKAELKLMKEEIRRVEEDKKKITGVYKTLEELVGLAKD